MILCSAAALPSLISVFSSFHARIRRCAMCLSVVPHRRVVYQAAARRHFHPWVLHSVVPSQPPENRQHHASSASFRPGSCCMHQLLCRTQQSSAGTHLHRRAASPQPVVQRVAGLSCGQPGCLQSRINTRAGTRLIRLFFIPLNNVTRLI